MNRKAKKGVSCLLTMTLLGCSNGSFVEENGSTGSVSSSLKITQSNGIDDFDLAFIKQIQAEENQIYSPLSIKYALCMLDDAASGQTEEELDSIIGNYVPSTYTNSENLSLANLFAIKDTIAADVDENLIQSLKEKYNADIFIDSFSSPEAINDWISEKTLGMIEDYNEDLDPSLTFMIVNALAMDMEWVNPIQDYFSYEPNHENFSKFIACYFSEKSQYTTFSDEVVDGVELAAISNRYDIVSELGEDSIREIVKKDILQKYEEDSSSFQWMINYYKASNLDQFVDIYLDEYMNRVQSNYDYYDQSTDFLYYVDDSIKVFAKDLKEYNGTAFQYIGIMPTTDSLNEYVHKLSAKNVNQIVNSLKDPSTTSYEEGYLTYIHGSFPIFSYSYSMDLDHCLQEMGLQSIYESNTDFESITSEPIVLTSSHKSQIDFSNIGIKASAVTEMSGLGSDGGFYDYKFDVPIQEIDLTFDQPFIYFIRNKDTGDIWFVGTVYEGNQEYPIITFFDDTDVKAEPSSSSNTLNTIPEYEQRKGTGKSKRINGLTWYELEDGGWVSDKKFLNISFEEF